MKVYCIDCGVMRMDEVDNTASEKDCQMTAQKPCRVCGCPYVEAVKW